jgi:hypothetical protein
MRVGMIGSLVLLLGTGSIHAQTGSVVGTVRLLPRLAAEPAAMTQYRSPSATAVIPPTPLPAVVFVSGSGSRRFPPPTQRPTLAQKNEWFIPEVMAVLVGTTVEFPNLDAQYHNVFSYSKPKRFDLGRYPTGESRSVTFDQPGVVKVYCEIHAHMQAFVVVCPNPWFAVTGTDGKFRLDAVPAGKHKLIAWRPRGAVLERDVEIVAGQARVVDFE